MAPDQLLRKNFWVIAASLFAATAYLNARAVTALIGIGLLPSEKELAAAPLIRPPVPIASAPRVASAKTILERNAFDHVTGPLVPSADAAQAAGGGANPVDATDPMNAPECDGVDVLVIAASDDEQWSFAALSGADGKSHLARRGGEIGGKKVHFVGWDRVWLADAGAVCQAKLFGKKKTPPKPAAPTPAPTTSTRPLARGARPVDPDIKKGIVRVSPTEYNVDRGVLDKILENQAELMRQARIVPEQQNGRVVGIRLLGVKKDSLLEVLGMQNGDRLQTINGFDMSSPEKALEAYARLRTAEKLTVQISRGGKTMNLDYNVR